jgi:hypothetical protein
MGSKFVTLGSKVIFLGGNITFLAAKVGSRNYFFGQQELLFLVIEIRNFGLFRKKIFVKMHDITKRLDVPFPKDIKQRFFLQNYLKKYKNENL